MDMNTSGSEEQDTAAREINVEGRRTRYWEYHPEQQRVIIFLHGFRGNHRGLVQVAEALSEFRVIVPDLPGYGESETLANPHDFEHYATWLKNFTTALQIDSCIVAGHSYGATLAIVAAAQKPGYLWRLLLVEPVLNAQTWTSRLGQAYYWIGAHLPEGPRHPWIASSLLNRLSTELMSVTREPELKQKIVRDEQANLQYIIPRVEIESYLGFYRIDIDQLAVTISAPTSIIAGQRDTMTPLTAMKKLAQEIPGARLTILPTAGHFVPMEDPQALVNALRQSLQHID